MTLSVCHIFVVYNKIITWQIRFGSRVRCKVSHDNLSSLPKNKACYFYNAKQCGKLNLNKNLTSSQILKHVLIINGFRSFTLFCTWKFPFCYDKML